MAEWLGAGLQKPVHRFDSGRRLDKSEVRLDKSEVRFDKSEVRLDKGALSSAW